MSDPEANLISSICRTLQLPPEIQRSYSNFGVKEVYDWQRECLYTTQILNGNNLVYCAPTSGGKTLVAELILLRTVLLLKKKVVFVLPFVSLVMEKERYLKKLLTIYNRSQPMKDRIKVRGFYGDQGGSRSYKEHVLVCTIEKANGIFNSLVSRGKIAQLGCVMFDEMHVLGNTFNGYLLEILISKIKFMTHKAQQAAEEAKQREHQHQVLAQQQAQLQQQLPGGPSTILSIQPGRLTVSVLPPQAPLSSTNKPVPSNTITTMHTSAQSLPMIQMIALSATMGNVAELAAWLGGAIYRTTFRPVPLIERIKAGNEVLDPQGNLLGTLPAPPAVAKGGGKSSQDPDPDHAIWLCRQALHQGQQVLVFCSSKYACLQTCRSLVDAFTLPFKTPFQQEQNCISMPVLTHQNIYTAASSSSAGDSSSSRMVDLGKQAQILEARKALVAALIEANPHAEETLKAGILHGVAYHNAGLTSGERQLVEKGFRSGAISILSATSTLAAGVNLPAGRVLIRSMSIGRETLNVMQYRQMCGRAGRKGQGNSIGESFLLVKSIEKQRALQLSGMMMPDVCSQMHPNRDGGNALLKAVLEVVGLGLCGTLYEAVVYVQQTLLYKQALRVTSNISSGSNSIVSTANSGGQSNLTSNNSTVQSIMDITISILNFLIRGRILDCDATDLNSALEVLRNSVYSSAQDSNHPAFALTNTAGVSPPYRLKITRFGRAIMQSNVNPDDAIIIYESLLRAQDGLHLENSLQVLYLVCPLEHNVMPNFRKLLGMYEHSSNSKNKFIKCLFDSVGIEYALLNKWQVSAPTKAMVDLCTNNVKLQGLYGSGTSSNSTPTTASTATTTTSINTYKHITQHEWKVLSYCKRLYAALALQSLLDGQNHAALCKEYNIEQSDLENLHKSTQIMCNKVTRFCEQVGWSAMQKLFTEFGEKNLKIDHASDSKEMRCLMEIPYMPRKLAKLLCEHSINSVTEFVTVAPAAVVQLLQLSIGFEVQELEEIEVRLEALENDTEACFSEDNNIIDLTSDDSSTSDNNKDSGIGGSKSGANTTTVNNKSSNPSKDAHTRQRLSLMVASLQNAARSLLQRESSKLDQQAGDVIAALEMGNTAERNTSNNTADVAVAAINTTKTHFSTSATNVSTLHGINTTDINAIRAYNQDTLGAQEEENSDSYSDVSDDENINLTSKQRSSTTTITVKTTRHYHNNSTIHSNDADSDVSEYEVADEDLEEAEAMAGIEQEMGLFSQQQRAELEQEKEQIDHASMEASDNVYLQDDLYGGGEGGINTQNLNSEKQRGLLVCAMATITTGMNSVPSKQSADEEVRHSESRSLTTALAGTTTSTLSLKRPHQPTVAVAPAATGAVSVDHSHLSLDSAILNNCTTNAVATTTDTGTTIYSQGDRSPAPKIPKIQPTGPVLHLTQQHSNHTTRRNLSAFPSFSYKPSVNLPPAAAAAAATSNRLSQRTSSLSQTQSIYTTVLPAPIYSQSTQLESPTVKEPQHTQYVQHVPLGGQTLTSPLHNKNNYSVLASGRKQHRVVFSPITSKNPITNTTSSILHPDTATFYTTINIAPIEYQFLATDAELNALMEELESAGVMECVVNGGADDNNSKGVSALVEANDASSESTDTTTMHYHYYPLEDMHANDPSTAVVLSPKHTHNNATHSTVTLTSSAFKMTVQRVPTAETPYLDALGDSNMHSNDMDIDIYDTDDSNEMTTTEMAEIPANHNNTNRDPSATSAAEADAAAATAFELAIIQMMEDLEARGVIPIGSASHSKRTNISNNNSRGQSNSHSRYDNSAAKTSMDDSGLYYNHTLPDGFDTIASGAIASPVLPPQPPLLLQTASLVHEDNSFDDFYNAANDECMDYENNNVSMNMMGAEDSRESVTGYSVGLKESFSLSVNINSNNGSGKPVYGQIAGTDNGRIGAFSPTVAMSSVGLQNGSSSSVRERAKQISLSGQRGQVRFDIDTTAAITAAAIGSGERNTSNSSGYNNYIVHSPYGTPFTPSKVRTPGRYLYYPLWQQDSSVKGIMGSNYDGSTDSPIVGPTLQENGYQYPSDCVPSEVIALYLPNTLHPPIDQPQNDSATLVSNPVAYGFGMRHISNPQHCRLFTQQLQTTRCVSFELLYRPLPASWLARYKPAPSGGTSFGAAAAGYSVYSWTPYISYACCKGSSVTSSSNDHFLDCSLSTDSGHKRNMFRSPHVVVGVAMCFGDAYGYFLPLPTPLPLPPNPYTSDQEEKNNAGSTMDVCDDSGGDKRTDSTTTLDSLPARCREIIVAYVGFGTLLTKCTTLRECMMESKSYIPSIASSTSTSHTSAVANPLFLVSRRWSYSARRALLLAWRRGGCTEWRLFSDVLSNNNITKVAVHLKSKMVVLRERDVLIEGPIADPSIAHTLLQHCSPCAEQDKNYNSDKSDGSSLAVNLQIPEIPHDTNDTSALTALHNGQKIACFRSVAVFRAMAKLEVKLRSMQCIDLFRNIEMLLLYSASDAEYSGLRVDAAFFSALRKQLSDRQCCIEQYFATLYGGDFNISSHGDVALLRKRLVSDSVQHVQNVIAKSAGGMVGFIDDTLNNNATETTTGNGNNSCSNSTNSNTISTTEIEHSIFHCIQPHHPLLKLVSEHRSHTRALPLCSSVLGSRCFDRVRAVYSTLGTETGRIILTNPPLQQMPKQCSFVPTARPSLHQELCACVDVQQRNALVAHLNHRNNAHSAVSNDNNTKSVITRFVQNKHQSSKGAEDRDWVRVVSLHRSAVLRNNNNSNRNPSSGVSAEEFSFGRLVMVTTVPISASPVDYNSISNYSSTLSNTATTTINATSSSTSISLVDMWRQGGFHYTATEASTIVQVLVEFSTPGHSAQNTTGNATSQCFAYPADKVLRTQAPMQGDPVEVAHISQSLSSDWIITALTSPNSSVNTAAISDSAEPLYSTVNPRDGFTASEGFVLLAADYLQVELRILAHFSADAGLLEAFHAQVDVFRAIAAKWLHKPSTTEVTDTERNQVKQICYALIYGAGPALVAQQALLSVETAQGMMKDFLHTYPGVETFLLHTKKQCRKQGYVQTLLGRRRYLPDITSTESKLKSKAERQAVNTLCQGSAADLIKLAMINIHTRLTTLSKMSRRQNNATVNSAAQQTLEREVGTGVEAGTLNFRRPRSNPGGGLYKQLDDVRPVLQVHDELVFEVRTQDVQRVATIVKECMEGAVVLNVPLSVKLSTGPSWGSLSPLTLIDANSRSGNDHSRITLANSSQYKASSSLSASTHEGKGLSPDPVSDHFSLYQTVMSRANSLLPISAVHVGETETSYAASLGISCAPIASVLHQRIHQRATTANIALPNIPPSRGSNNTAGGGSPHDSNIHGVSLPIVRDLFGRD